MTIVYIGLLINFLALVGSWVIFFKFLKLKDMSTYMEIEELRGDLDLVTKNPAAARRKLKKRQ